MRALALAINAALMVVEVATGIIASSPTRSTTSATRSRRASFAVVTTPGTVLIGLVCRADLPTD